MKKTSIITALAILFLLASCQEENSNPTSTPGVSTQSPTSTPTLQPTTTAIAISTATETVPQSQVTNLMPEYIEDLLPESFLEGEILIQVIVYETPSEVETGELGLLEVGTEVKAYARFNAWQWIYIKSDGSGESGWIQQVYTNLQPTQVVTLIELVTE